MPTIVPTEYGYMQYDVSLQGDQNRGFQWNIILSRIVDEDNGHKVYRVKNRDWELVGPEFKTRDEGSRYLGFSSKSSENVPKHWEALVAEYAKLYSDEVETIDNISFEPRKFGRPSQGRTERLQFSATPTMKSWLEAQAHGKESVSQTVYRLLEGIM